MKAFLLVSVVVSCLNIPVLAQSNTEQPKPPKTKLESFLATDGVVLIQGSSTIGNVKSGVNGAIEVDSKELIDATSGRKEYGISIELSQSNGTTRLDRSTSYVDYDEIDALLKGLDYISKVDKSVTKLDGYQATYRTRDDLSMTIYSGEKGLSGFFSNTVAVQNYLLISSGTIGRVSIRLKADDVPKVRELIVKAKQKLDEIKR